MPATKVQLTGGSFQDSEGNLLVNGYLKMRLNQDELVTGVGQICSGVEITIQLNASASVDTVAAQRVWGNDQMLPVNSYYRVTGYKANGQLAWGPNNQQVNGSGGTFDVGTWVPNTVLSWFPPLQPLDLETNGISNPSQTVLNFEDTASVTWVIDADGTLHATAGGGLTLQTEGVNNADQTKLNLESIGGSVVITDEGSGSVNFDISLTPSASEALLGNLHGILTNPASSAFTGIGATPQTIGSGPTPENPTAVDAPYMQLISQAISNGQGVVFDNNNTGIALGPLKYWQCKSKISSNGAGIAWFAGMSNVNPGSTLMQNPPTTQKVAMFYWKTGDANWSALACGGSGSNTIVDTGVPVDTAFHLFQIFSTAGGTSLTYKLDGVTVATITTTLPAAGDILSTIVAVQANAVENDVQYIWWSF